MSSHIQYGHGMPVFVGKRIQRGYGLGGVFSSLAKSILLPAVKSIGTSLLSSGLKRATKVVDDVGRGKSVKQAIVDQFTPSSMVRAGAKKAASVLNEFVGEPRGRKSGPSRRRRREPERRPSKRRKLDIFDSL